MDRIVVNESIDELQKYYSKDVLPKDYNGDCETISELQDRILKTLSQEKHIEHMKTMNKVKIDTTMCSHFSDENGIEGTFRSLNID